GHEVLLFERHPAASGASIRNFGMVWPIGQANGPNHRSALRSHSLWLELLQATGIWHRECGSLHLAYRDDEFEVLAEFARIAPELGYEVQLLSPGDVARVSPAARRDRLQAGLCSQTEVCVDPREVLRHTPSWLRDVYGVDTLFDTAVT